jgi:predicted GIY-YIG superfamily endonuclease
VCNVEVCDRKAVSKGMCDAHYRRVLRGGGDLTTPIGRPQRPETCTLEGCEAEYAKAGYCIRHYTNWWRHGDPYRPSRKAYTDNGPTYVYRMYGTNDELLYVGITNHLSRRMEVHFTWKHHKKEWAGEVIYMKAELFPCRDSAKWAERQLVQRNVPKYNVLLRGE